MKNSISKRRLIGLSKYQIFGNCSQYISMGITLLINFFVALIIGLVVNDGKITGGSIDFPMMAMSTVFGVAIVTSGMKFSMVNGISRKTYYISAVICIVIGAIGYSMLTYVAMLITHNTGHSADAYFLLYCHNGMNWAGMFFFEFFTMLTMMAIGFFTTLVFFRTRKRGKMIIFVSVFALAAVLALISFFADIWSPIFIALKTLFGYGFDTPNPFIGGLTLLAISCIFFGGSYLLVRRADIRE